MAQALLPVSVPRQVGRGVALVAALVVVSLSSRATVCRSARFVLRALGVRLAGPASLPTGELLVANHISWLDAIAVLAVGPVTFLAKREVTDWPLIGRVTGRVGTVYIDRAGMAELPDVVGCLADELRRGRTVAVFPGGTTWCEPPGGPFHSAVFQAAVDAGARVRPVTISYEQHGLPSTVAAFVGDGTLLASIREILRARDLIVHVQVHGPLPYNPAAAARTTRHWLADAAYQVISRSHG